MTRREQLWALATGTTLVAGVTTIWRLRRKQRLELAVMRENYERVAKEKEQLRHMLDENIPVGDPEQGVQFFKRNLGIEEIYHKAMDIAQSIYSDENVHTLPANGVVAFGLISTAYEIFLELFCLAANGFGRGAQARLRTLYEHVAIAAFVTQHADQAERFVKFQVVEQRNELTRARVVLDKPSNEAFLQRIDMRLVKLEADLQTMKTRYGKRFAGSWHEGIATVSSDLGWEHHFFYDYLIPNRHVHASALALERRFSTGDGDRSYFEAAPDTDLADEAVRGGLTVLALSFAVAKDLALPVKEVELNALSAALVRHYKDRPNKMSL